jgi:GNAT superfamily N-acetyltransferase
MRIRLAKAGEGPALSALCVRSKAHWGYDARFMALSAAALRVEESEIAAGRVAAAVDDSDRPLGVAHLDPHADGLAPGEVDLGLLFVDPSAMGIGAGRALLDWCVAEARRLGARRLVILADPNAAPFYVRCGARYLEDKPSDAIPGRTLPFYALDIGASS